MSEGLGSLADRIAADIREGRFSQGSWLKQIDLQERYARNRSDIRRALEQLSHKRLIEYVPNRGYYVHREDDDKAIEIRDIRLYLETGAAPEIVARAEAADIARLSALAETFRRLLPDGTIFEIYEANLRFHRALLDLTGNRSLVDLVEELRLRTSPAPASQWATRARIEQSAEEHFEMVAAIEARDAPKLRTVIEAHIRQGLGGAPGAERPG
ncbi:GntR family transcriptional regulator [Aureimonas glaciei]|uniref:GntR family transcriptional regulator n=1 Tax=Aureimonas glaciei TaxID=1776957 RepID=A0A917D902_9HYPH|nr:GntR family transcriptional regulator [Aureimonas glaciei]GGD10703.1 GntR family transcriptional regulator [Aureimonas glaciei]